MKKYDVIVIGGGHAGIESAMACKKMGVSILLITFEKEKIGYMSCNPAIGGVGKGQIVKEIDALGGEMAKATDKTGIQFRILNKSKGPAVWSSRAQVDRKKYNEYMKNLIEKNVEILEGEVTDLIVENNVVKGVEVNNEELIYSKCVILAPGTFLNGLIHIGLESFPAGRIEDKKCSKKLSEKLKELGFEILRFKTGTCARLDGNTIDFSILTPQFGDEPPKPFSFSTENLEIEQVPCYITYTNEKTHEIIRKNLNRSPLYTGKITGIGVRYCPSIEDKVVKFPHHPRHHIFLEPEGKDINIYYPNGISTSLPIDVQDDFIHTIKGLENVKILRYGYGIEHDVVNPLQIYPTLETKIVKNLFLAGQINGTTGYEEAGGQGLIAGINAVLKIKNQPELILDRTTSYIGVLIDDLTTKGTNEPYRMFTSRVEYRLMIREDNADIRLREIGYKLGLVSEEEWEKTKRKIEEIEKIKKYLQSKKITIEGKTITLFEYVRRPGIKILDYIKNENFHRDSIFTAEVEIKYAPYIERNLKEIEEFRNLEKIKIPENFDYSKIPGLSLEIREKLSKFKPLNLGQANRIPGITPSAISILLVYLKKFSP
ncbi:MAG: tRNA uridine-5-carboxymethylaminomethyl(34) synthesis enzyme MnmG [Candidatus Omnitrophica bacterium]|nr:tRNA uridine-5-carboxymethylaminomethyl(34) synthesis enzyme MnmG [Candidatus Omnitrophota bacterium]MCM8807638.1 tRNA uridine-5-carboxymethylaminomethyl(34) synthesis enzyme MnmG [Candidatus Omnitrophota bacterium]